MVYWVVKCILCFFLRNTVSNLLVSVQYFESFGLGIVFNDAKNVAKLLRSNKCTYKLKFINSVIFDGGMISN